VTAVVEVTRGRFVESRHRVHVVVAHADRGVVAACGSPQYVGFVRSAIKMFQALPLAEDGVVPALGLLTTELALCTASHNAEPFHVATARSLLAKAGATEEALACGPHPPMHPPAAAALATARTLPSRIHNNCSGKHAGMLALARFHGWPLSGYHLPDHPAQRRVARTLTAWTECAHTDMVLAVDGCGLPTFALPLDRVAAACARFAAAALSPSPAQTIVEAMTNHPEFVAGTGRLCTLLMQAAKPLRLFAKVGAEGYYCAGVPEMRLGIALKVEDGAKRAAGPALLATLRAVDALSDSQLAAMSEFSHPQVLNTRGEVVGEVRVQLALH
jgi:L-asparaginase II